MDKEIKQLNKQIEEYLGEFRKADETIFNFGVQLGRILEKNNIENHRLSFFVEQEAQSNQVDAKSKVIDGVNKIIQNIISWAHKEQISNSGSICYEAGWRSSNNTPLDEDIAKKYNIAYSNINQTNVGGDFDINFMLTGQLKDIFEKHQVGIQVETTLSNSSGEEEEYIIDEDDAETSFYSTHIFLYPHNNDKTLEEIEAFAKDVEKFYTMFCLKLN